MNTEERFYALDAVRVFALLTGIVLHSTMSFLPGFREYNWPIADVSPSLTLAVMFFVIHIFRMTLFFIVAGFFARLLLHRTGVRGFVRNRLRRIALPLLVFWIVVTPLTVIALIWGATQLGVKGPPKIPPPAPQRGLPWGHLWFLYVLLVLYVLGLGIRWCVIRIDGRARLRTFLDTSLRRLMASGWAPLGLALPLALCLYFTEWWSMWQGIPTPFAGFVPNIPALLGYGTAFAFGWLLHRQQSLLQSMREHWWAYLTAAICLSAIALVIVGPRPRWEVIPLAPLSRLAFVASYTIAIWCWSFAIIGGALRHFSAQSPAWQYVSDASYWMYLIHVPVVFVLHAWMMQWPLHWTLKFPLIVCLAFTIVLATYRYGVRATFIGVLLNGRRRSGNLSKTTLPAAATQ